MKLNRLGRGSISRLRKWRVNVDVVRYWLKKTLWPMLKQYVKTWDTALLLQVAIAALTITLLYLALDATALIQKVQ